MNQAIYRVAIGPSSFAQQDHSPLRFLEKSGIEVVPNPFNRRLTESEIMELLLDVDGLIAGLEPLNRSVLQSASRLKAIARVGIGLDNVDQLAAEELGIKVSNTPDEPSAAVAEMVLAALLTLARGLLPANDALHHGKWLKSIGSGLQGIPILLVGFGRIGRQVANLLQAFEADVLVTDPYIDAKDLPSHIRQVNLHEGLSLAKVISLHASGNDCLIGSQEFDQMKVGTILLNSARGGLVDESALLSALDSGKLKAAWFDVFWQEPYDGPLTKYDQVLLTPHMSTYTQQCRMQMELAAVKNLLRDLGLDK